MLCLRGADVRRRNAQKFKKQSRTLVAQLESRFRLCFADGPSIRDPGPGMIPVNKDYGPFRR